MAIQLPFSDQAMNYSDKTHRYTLTKECVFDELGVNLDVRLNVATNDNPSNAAQLALEQISRHVYNFIYTNSNAGNKLFLELLLAKYEPCREIVKQAMENEVLYALQNGTFWNFSGVNIGEGRAMDLSMLRDRRVVSDDTERLLSQLLPNGIRLLYQGVYSIPPFNPYEGY